jgi:adenylyltransferase/sulfurtransferase
MYDECTSDLVENHSIVVDCSDNIGTRYLLNDACFLAGKVLISAAALGIEGSLTRWGENGGSCYRCVIPQPSSLEARRRCADQGVLGPVPGVLGALQALDVLRYLSKHDGMINKIHIFDGTGLKSFELPPRRPTCELCGEAQVIESLQDSKQWALDQGLHVDLDETL